MTYKRKTWREKRYLNEKFPGGALAYKQLLKEEGFTLLPKDKRFFVKDCEACLVKRS